MFMKKSHSLSSVSLAIVLLGAMSAVAAQEKNCIELQTVAEVEEQYLDEQGRNATRLVPAGKIVPGDQVVWTITARNVCAAAAGNIVIANDVPEHMSYVADSAMGVGTDIVYSLDGKHFAQPGELTVENDAGSRLARADEYRSIRWTYTVPFAQGATAFVRYRATVE